MYKSHTLQKHHLLVQNVVECSQVPHGICIYGITEATETMQGLTANAKMRPNGAQVSMRFWEYL